MNWLSVILRVEATNPPTFTCAPRPKVMPLGLISKTWPLADRLPLMVETPPPSTRLSAAELLLGWMNWTASPLPMLKLCQLMVTDGVDSVTTILPAALFMAALPADTVPPAGMARTLSPKDRIMATASALRVKRVRFPMARPRNAPLLPAQSSFSDPEVLGATTALSRLALIFFMALHRTPPQKKGCYRNNNNDGARYMEGDELCARPILRIIQA